MTGFRVAINDATRWTIDSTNDQPPVDNVGQTSCLSSFRLDRNRLEACSTDPRIICQGNRTTTTWNYENQPTLYRLPSGGRVTMAYNGDNRRVLKQEPE
jgi:YD repeat-containing protein